MSTKALVTVTILLFSFTKASNAERSADFLKRRCEPYLKVMDKAEHAFDGLSLTEAESQSEDALRCQAFVDGMMDESAGEIFFRDEDRAVVWVGVWQNAKSSVGADIMPSDQLIRAFFKYVDLHPEFLTRPATWVLLRAAENAGLYVYRNAPRPLTTCN
jgi:hypothetical protein